MAKKLELVWGGNDKELKVEPRILLYDRAKSHGDQNMGNMLIHGDNLLAVKALEAKYAGQVKCIYIDIFMQKMMQFFCRIKDRGFSYIAGVAGVAKRLLRNLPIWAVLISLNLEELSTGVAKW